MTRTSAMMGTPLYMSPEQLVSARTVDERADIWALGVILYELVSGQVPFMASTLPELGALVLSGNAPDVRGFAPHCPPGLAAAVARCLRKDASDRFANLADFAAAIAPFGSPAARTSADHIANALGTPTSSRGSDPGLLPSPTSSPGTGAPQPHAQAATPAPLSGPLPVAAAASAAGWARTSDRPRRRSSLPWVAGGVAAVVVIGGGGLAAWRATHSTPDAGSNRAASAPAVETPTPPAATTPSFSPPPPVVTVPAGGAAPDPSASAPAAPSSTPKAVASSSSAPGASAPPRRTPPRRAAPAASATPAPAVDRHQF